MADADDFMLGTSYEEWQLVGESYFSRRELYELDWARGPRGINLEYMRCEKFEIEYFCYHLLRKLYQRFKINNLRFWRSMQGVLFSLWRTNRFVSG